MQTDVRWRSERNPIQRMTGLGLVVAIAVSMTACATTTDQLTKPPSGELSTDQSDQRQRIIDDFARGVGGTASCTDLFTLRNQLDHDDPYIESTMTPKLQRIRCFSSSSSRGDQSTTTRPQKAYDQLGIQLVHGSRVRGNLVLIRRIRLRRVGHISPGLRVRGRDNL